MQYDDDEGDRVLLTTDSDLAGAVLNAKSSGLKVFPFSELEPICLLKMPLFCYYSQHKHPEIPLPLCHGQMCQSFACLLCLIVVELGLAGPEVAH